jgi:hypothetical protein
MLDGCSLAILHLKCIIANMSFDKGDPGFISRALEPTLRQAVEDFPVVVHTGDIVLPLGEHALALPMHLL